jgi:hypothetical protein
MGEMRNSYNISATKPEGKTPLGRPRRRWEGNIRMDVWEMAWEGATGFIWLRIGASGRFL